MARSYGQIVARIWRDPDFIKLAAAAQWAYLMLATQADISSCGLLPVTLGRWAGYAPDVSRDRLAAALQVLSDHRFIVVDWDTEELLVRTFVKWDGGANNEKRRPAISKAAHAVSSPMLRAVLAVELDKLRVPHKLHDAPPEPDPEHPRDREPDSPSMPYSPVDNHPEDTPPDSPSDAPPDAPSMGYGIARGVVNSPTSLRPQPGTVTMTGTVTPTQIHDLGGEPPSATTRSNTADSVGPPDDHCPRHPHGSDLPCTACARARKTRATWDTTHQRHITARRNAILNCPDCHGDHWLNDDTGRPTARCTHPHLTGETHA